MTACTAPLFALNSASGIDLWQVDLDAPPAEDPHAVLGEEERARASRFVFEADRRRYIAAHVGLRQVLALCTGAAAAALDFSVGPYGKPEIRTTSGFAPRPFNLSHSQSTAVIAVGAEGSNDSLGVDAEIVRTMPDALLLAADHFTTAEYHALLELEGEARDRAFLICWTRKEACLKALGLGLALSPKCFEVGVLPDARTVVLPSGGALTRLAITPLELGPAIVGSLAHSTRCGAEHASDASTRHAQPPDGGMPS